MADEPQAVPTHTGEMVVPQVSVGFDEENGYTNNGTHGVLVVHAGGLVTRIQPGESVKPAKEGGPAVVLRNK